MNPINNDWDRFVVNYNFVLIRLLLSFDLNKVNRL